MKQLTVIFTAIAFLACSGSSKSADTTTTNTNTGTGTGDDATETAAADPWTMDDGPMQDDDIGLSKTSVFETPAPEWYSFPKEEPGKNELLPRGFIGAPPSIPHAVADYLPITIDENPCKACHLMTTEEPGGPTPLPESHFIDYRDGETKPGDFVYDARYRCLFCHVPLSDAPPLVETNFEAQP